MKQNKKMYDKQINYKLMSQQQRQYPAIQTHRVERQINIRTQRHILPAS